MNNPLETMAMVQQLTRKIEQLERNLAIVNQNQSLMAENTACLVDVVRSYAPVLDHYRNHHHTGQRFEDFPLRHVLLKNDSGASYLDPDSKSLAAECLLAPTFRRLGSPSEKAPPPDAASELPLVLP